jgi:AmiR/NasT family two-component response regulator
MTLPLQTVAIADDEAGIRSVLKAIVADLGYKTVGAAQNGAEAVEMVRQFKPNVILLDVHMPVLDGLEATRQIVALGTTAVVILTGDPNPEMARTAMDLGACGYMQKPFDQGQIAAILESAWHRLQTTKALQEKTRSLDEALEMRKLTEKAKGILMEQQGFSEAEAHHTLQKLSQDQGLPLKEVCRSIIQVRMVLGKKTKKIA